jgi:hypothetical protein
MYQTQESQEYGHQILDWYLQIQVFLINKQNSLPIREYMSCQQDINWKMRQTLMLWLIQVSQEFKLEQETLFLGFNLLDRIGSLVHIQTHQYQLVGLVCLWIASKTEQNHGTVPSLKRLQQMCLNTYTKQEFKDMERFILIQLQFNITHVSPLAFIDILFEMEGNPMGQVGVSLATYLAEISVLHRRFVGIVPLTIARASIGLAKLVLLGQQTDSVHIQSVMHQLMDCLRNQPTTLIKKVSFYNKYSSTKFQCCSKIVQQYTQPTLHYGMLTPPKDTFWGTYKPEPTFTWTNSFAREYAQWGF